MQAAAALQVLQLLQVLHTALQQGNGLQPGLHLAMPDPQNIRKYLEGNLKHESAVAYAKDIRNGLEVSRWHARAANLAENPVPKRRFAVKANEGVLSATYTPVPW